MNVWKKIQYLEANRFCVYEANIKHVYMYFATTWQKISTYVYVYSYICSSINKVYVTLYK